MVGLGTQQKIRGIQLQKEPDNPEAEPLFYWVPCAGVRYYTYDYRPALQKMMARWGEQSEEEKVA